MMHLPEKERRRFVQFLSRAIRLDSEHTIEMLVGDESDLPAIVESHQLAIDVRDALCEHWSCPSSTDDYDGEFICVDCGEEFVDARDVNRRARDTKLSTESSARGSNETQGDDE